LARTTDAQKPCGAASSAPRMETAARRVVAPREGSREKQERVPIDPHAGLEG